MIENAEHGLLFHKVTKDYTLQPGAVIRALKEIDLFITPGRFIGLAGRNASGKSTLARLANGLMLPTSGHVLVDGMDTGRPDLLLKIRSRVGMVFQNPDNQIISPIVEEDIGFGPKNMGVGQSEIKERVQWALKVVGMSEYRYHDPNLLSGGQKQKVAVASALAMKPPYLILDEPTSMLDPAGRLDLIECLNDLHRRENIAILLISHNLEDLLLTDRMVILNEGRIYFDGKTEEILAKPDCLMEIGLKPPDIASLADHLRGRGHCVPNYILTPNQMVEFICGQLK